MAAAAEISLPEMFFGGGGGRTIHCRDIFSAVAAAGIFSRRNIFSSAATAAAAEIFSPEIFFLAAAAVAAAAEIFLPEMIFGGGGGRNVYPEIFFGGGGRNIPRRNIFRRRRRQKYLPEKYVSTLP